ncbi:uncharacterized protein [Elaeis guineensis]|uniref:uncharacterized protein n=1 Tax=Elaeis guineensis var. tenera TaxID=51953 RepID=UPI003C6D94C8
MLTYKQRRTSGKLLRRRTKAGMTSVVESITESLRHTCQLMVQEVERSANTLATFEESTSVLKKAEGEYQGHRSLLMRTRRLLSTMQCQDVMDIYPYGCIAIRKCYQTIVLKEKNHFLLDGAFSKATGDKGCCRGSCLQPSRKVQKDTKRWLWKSRERQLEMA